MSSCIECLYLATHNLNKVDELLLKFRSCGLTVKVLPASEVTGQEEWIEDGATFAANALIKAKFVRRFTDEWILADDSGLTVDALGGEPGIFSSRYAGDDGGHAANNLKLLSELKRVKSPNSRASFVTVLCLLAPDGQQHYFTGRLGGSITEDQRGGEGFGYDPLFIPDGFDKTLAELGRIKKNELSHRSRAVDEFISFAKLRGLVL